MKICFSTAVLHALMSMTNAIRHVVARRIAPSFAAIGHYNGGLGYVPDTIIRRQSPASSNAWTADPSVYMSYRHAPVYRDQDG
jgi:hypothetical protein